MIFGDKNSFAIESAIYFQHEAFIRGQFGMWAHGEAIGNFEDSVALQGCANWLQDFLVYSGQRLYEDCENVSDDVIMSTILEHIDNYEIEDSHIWRDKYILTDAGMSSFNNLEVILIECSDGSERLIWAELGRNEAKSISLRAGEFEIAANEFLQWIYNTEEWHEYREYINRLKTAE